MALKSTRRTTHSTATRTLDQSFPAERSSWHLQDRVADIAGNSTSSSPTGKMVLPRLHTHAAPRRIRAHGMLRSSAWSASRHNGTFCHLSQAKTARKVSRIHVFRRNRRQCESTVFDALLVRWFGEIRSWNIKAHLP
jgi:hypothetical protein